MVDKKVMRGVARQGTVLCPEKPPELRSQENRPLGSLLKILTFVLKKHI